jgi:hypothetical protein
LLRPVRKIYRWGKQRCGESVGMAASGLNVILGRGLNINALPRNECRLRVRVANMAMGHPGFRRVWWMRVPIRNFQHRTVSPARDRDG